MRRRGENSENSPPPSTSRGGGIEEAPVSSPENAPANATRAPANVEQVFEPEVQKNKSENRLQQKETMHQDSLSDTICKNQSTHLTRTQHPSQCKEAQQGDTGL